MTELKLRIAFMDELPKLLLEAVVAGAGAFLGSYLKKKGENLATHEDIDNVLEQVKAVTMATKEIEAQISSDVWERQKRWELKRDVLFQTMKAIAALRDALIFLSSICSVQNEELDPKKRDLVAGDVSAANEKWFEAARRFDEAALLVALVCGTELTDLLQTFVIFMRGIAKELGRDPTLLGKSKNELWQQSAAIKAAMRKEMGMGLSESAAALSNSLAERKTGRMLYTLMNTEF